MILILVTDIRVPEWIMNNCLYGICYQNSLSKPENSLFFCFYPVILNINRPYRQVAPTDKWPLQTRGPYIQDKPLHVDKEIPRTRGPYRQGALIDKEFIQTRTSTVKDPYGYSRCVIHTDKGLLQTICRQFIDN